MLSVSYSSWRNHLTEDRCWARNCSSTAADRTGLETASPWPDDMDNRAAMHSHRSPAPEHLLRRSLPVLPNTPQPAKKNSVRYYLDKVVKTQLQHSQILQTVC